MNDLTGPLTQKQRDWIAEHESYHLFYQREKMTEDAFNKAFEDLMKQFQPTAAVNARLDNTRRTLNGVASGTLR